MSAGIVVLTKVAAPGKVKTRLAAEIGTDKALLLHTAMLDHTISLARSTGLDVTVSLAGSDNGATAARLIALGVEVQQQPEGDLGDKLRHAMGHKRRMIALGSDCVVFDPQWLIDAAESPAPVAIGPSDDGGYWTIVIDGERDDLKDALLTDMPWSQPTLMRQTIARLKQLGVDYTALPESYDVDQESDLSRLLADPRCPPRVLEIMRSA